MVSPESRSNWITFRESGIPQSAVFFAPNGNGMDIIRPTDHSGYKYEDQCFLALAERFPDHYIVGPHLIDYMAGKHHKFKGMVVPDVLFLQTMNADVEETPGVYSATSAVVLSGFSEFKSGKILGFQKKVDGFMSFLDRLRGNPDTLLTALQETVGEYVEIPDRMIIPQNDEFQIRLVKPDDRKSSVTAPQGITLEFITIPIAV